MARIALIGDFSESVLAHRAIPEALRATAPEGVLQWEWLHSSALTGSMPERLRDFAGIWCVPGSPYVNERGILQAIRFAREARRPFLGTCGGFQHAVLEYARNVWRLGRAAHAESQPGAVDPVIAPLPCALIDMSESLQLLPGTRLQQAYGVLRTTEEYRCNYGLNPEYAERLQQGSLRIAALDADGAVRAVELEDHPFFVATLFQPERAALRGAQSPLIKAFASVVLAAGTDSR